MNNIIIYSDTVVLWPGMRLINATTVAADLRYEYIAISLKLPSYTPQIPLRLTTSIYKIAFAWTAPERHTMR